MSVIQSSQVQVLKQDGPLTWFKLTGITTADTWDASPWYRKVIAAYQVPRTGASAGVFATIGVTSNNQLTMSQTSVSLDAVDVFLFGVI